MRKRFPDAVVPLGIMEITCLRPHYRNLYLLQRSLKQCKQRKLEMLVCKNYCPKKHVVCMSQCNHLLTKHNNFLCYAHTGLLFPKCVYNFALEMFKYKKGMDMLRNNGFIKYIAYNCKNIALFNLFKKYK